MLCAATHTHIRMVQMMNSQDVNRYLTTAWSKHKYITAEPHVAGGRIAAPMCRDANGHGVQSRSAEIQQHIPDTRHCACVQIAKECKMVCRFIIGGCAYFISFDPDYYVSLSRLRVQCIDGHRYHRHVHIFFTSITRSCEPKIGTFTSIWTFTLYTHLSRRIHHTISPIAAAAVAPNRVDCANELHKSVVICDIYVCRTMPISCQGHNSQTTTTKNTLFDRNTHTLINSIWKSHLLCSRAMRGRSIITSFPTPGFAKQPAPFSCGNFSIRHRNSTRQLIDGYKYLSHSTETAIRNNIRFSWHGTCTYAYIINWLKRMCVMCALLTLLPQCWVVCECCWSLLRP